MRGTLRLFIKLNYVMVVCCDAGINLTGKVGNLKSLGILLGLSHKEPFPAFDKAYLQTITEF